MKVGIVSYPALWQRRGGLQIQIEKTSSALCRLGVDLRLLDLRKEKLGSCDIVHAFSGAHGMHVLIQEAKRQGAKVVLSPVMQPEVNLKKFFRYKLLDRLVFQFSSNQMKTSYGQLKSALLDADQIFALSAKESAAIQMGYEITGEKIAVIPNGVDDGFFDEEKLQLPQSLAIPENYVLISASISEYKNQIAVIEATERPIVLVGEVTSPEYLRKCLSLGGSRVTYVGAFNHADPILKSLYANAAVNVLASQGEAGPLCVIESLACKVPAVVTEKNGLPLEAVAPMLQYVNNQNKAALRTSIERGANADSTEREKCKAMVASFRWSMVAEKILPFYQRLVN